MTIGTSSPLLLFDFADQAGRAQRLCFRDPVEVLVAHSLDEVRPALRRVQQAREQGYYAAGYLAYEAAPAFDPAMAVRAGGAMPLLWFGIFSGPAPLPALPTAGFSLGDWQPSITRSAYDAAIAEVRAAIGRGDTYQANFTLRLQAAMRGSGLAFYEQLRAAQQADYCAYLDLGRWQILSASPELFFRWRDGALLTRPMKGTTRRGRWLEEDSERAAWLAASAKNRAENLMIVDLLRNDLGRVAEIGSVHVPALFSVERYPTLFQLTSTVTGRTRPGLDLDELLAALFPCGSITGAPKIETMKLIARLEDSPRGVYCGAVGLLSPDEAVFNVAIRTVVVDQATGRAEYGVGGGITWDSRADDEYDEALAKAALLGYARLEVTLLETLRLEQGNYWLLEGHLRRLADSARYFDMPCDQAELRAALAQHAAVHPQALRRVRLLLDHESLRVESTPLDALPPGPLPVALATEPVSRTDPLLYHKTTSRAVYAAARASVSPDVFDVLLWNEAGELTEFSIGNLVAEIAGQLLTPPRTSGLLNGVLRADLLGQGRIQERLLTRPDLQQATRLWLINSLRGWVEVVLSENIS